MRGLPSVTLSESEVAEKRVPAASLNVGAVVF